MQSAARAAIRFVAARAREDLDADELLRRGVVNAVQEIGEAAARMSPAGRLRAPLLPWDQIVAMRNILVHVYWGVDLDQLWKVVAEDLPILLADVDSALASLPADVEDAS